MSELAFKLSRHSLLQNKRYETRYLHFAMSVGHHIYTAFTQHTCTVHWVITLREEITKDTTWSDSHHGDTAFTKAIYFLSKTSEVFLKSKQFTSQFFLFVIVMYVPSFVLCVMMGVNVYCTAATGCQPVYCLCVNVYCTTATGCHPNCS
jgi:hypothetical protein